MLSATKWVEKKSNEINNIIFKFDINCKCVKF